MGFERDTLATLVNRIDADIAANLPNYVVGLRQSVERVLAQALGGVVHGLHGHLVYLSKQLFPDTAEGEFLERIAGVYGIERIEGERATGSLTAIASAGGVAVPSGTVWISGTGTEFVQDFNAVSFEESTTWQSLAYSPSLHLFVAVASSSSTGHHRIMTSVDGIAWTPRGDTNKTWQSIVWSPQRGIFVAVASGGDVRVMTSSDGITWTNRTAAALNAWQSVTWSPELLLFVAVANTGTADTRVMTSSDGIVWTSRTAASENAWQSVTWSPDGIFVAVSTNGTSRVMTSANGTSWTARTAAASNTWQSVTWSPQNGIFVAVANSGTNRVMTSPNGITWTARAASEASSWSSVAWSPELLLFVAVATAGTNRVMTSPDGITWTSRTAAAANQWNEVVWSPTVGAFVAVAGTGTGRVMLSYDGNTWRTAYAVGIAANEYRTFVSVTAREKGSSGNITSSSGLSLRSPIASVNDIGTSVTVSGGSDDETDDALLARLLLRLRNTPRGGAETDYEQWALEVSGVTRAWALSRQYGVGTVGVAFVRDNDGGGEDIIPDSTEVAAVQAYINARKPATADARVFAPTAVLVTMTINLPSGTSASVQTAITAKLDDYFARSSEPGATLYISQIREAISSATGEVTHTLPTVGIGGTDHTPPIDIAIGSEEIAIRSTITYGTI